MGTSSAVTAYPQDNTGALASNLITGETQILTINNASDYRVIIPDYGPFFSSSLVISFTDTQGVLKVLTKGKDWLPVLKFEEASQSIGIPVYGGIGFLDLTLEGVATLQYQTLGGVWVMSQTAIEAYLANIAKNPLVTTWEEIANLPYAFPTVNHPLNLADTVGMSDLITAINAMVTQLYSSGQNGLADHIANKDNPHAVTATQVGLGLVQNFGVASSADTILGTSASLYVTPAGLLAALNAGPNASITTHVNNQSNPHKVTAAQVGTYDSGTLDNLLAAKLSSTAQAADSAKFGGYLPADFMAYVLTGTAANATKAYGLTLSQLASQIAVGGDLDASTFNGYTYAQVVTNILAGTAANATQFGGYSTTDYANKVLTGTAANATTVYGLSQAALTAAILAGTAANATQFNGMNYTAAKADILSGTAANSVEFGGFTYTAAKADILSGTAANATLFNGYAYSAVKTDILTGTAANATQFAGMSQSAWQAYITSAATSAGAAQYTDTYTSGEATANVWVLLGTVPIATSTSSNSATPDALWLVAGGEYSNDTDSDLFLIRVSGRQSGNSVAMQAISLTNKTTALKFGYVIGSSGSSYVASIYMYTGTNRNQITVTEINKAVGTISSAQTALTTAPSGITYATNDGFVLQSDLTTALNNVNTAIQNLQAATS